MTPLMVSVVDKLTDTLDNYRFQVRSTKLTCSLQYQCHRQSWVTNLLDPIALSDYFTRSGVNYLSEGQLFVPSAYLSQYEHTSDSCPLPRFPFSVFQL